MPVTDPEISFNVNDRGGEYYEKLQNLAAAISEIIGAHNSLESGALSEDDLTPVGQNLVAIPTPEGPRFIRVNADGSISILTAAEFLSAIGASSGMANPMDASGDMIVGGDAGAPTKVAKGPNSTLWAVDAEGGLGYLGQNSEAFDFGRWARARRPSADFLSAAFNVDTDVQPGQSVWVAFSALGTHPAWSFATDSSYRLDDDVILKGASSMSRRQIATPRVTTEERRNAAYRMVRYKLFGLTNEWSPWKRLDWDEAPINGKPHVRKDGAWVESSGGGISTASIQTFDADDQVSNNITVTCDCTTHNHHPLDFNGSPTPSTAGSYIINLTNLPASTTELVVGHIAARRLGRKSTVTIQASGFTAAWLATPSFQSGTTGIDYIQYKIDPLAPTVLRLSQVYSRSS